MAKNKLTTPVWILEGFDSEADYNKAKDLEGKKNSGGKTFKIRKCPECNSFDVVVVTEKEVVGLWRCRKCGWEGKNVGWEELTEQEFMKYMDEIAPKGVPSIEGDMNIEGREVA